MSKKVQRELQRRIDALNTRKRKRRNLLAEESNETQAGVGYSMRGEIVDRNDPLYKAWLRKRRVAGPLAETGPDPVVFGGDPSALTDGSVQGIPGTYSNMAGCWVDPSGGRVLVADYGTDDIDLVTMTGFDHSTMVNASSVWTKANNLSTTAMKVAADPDGTYIWYVDNSDDTVSGAPVTGWDLASMGNPDDEYTHSEVAICQGGMTFSDDGNYMYIVGLGGASQIIQRYELGTAWDVSTASASGSLDVTTDLGGAGGRGLCINAAGTKVFVLGKSGYNTICSFTLGTPFDISTGTYDGASTDFSTGIGANQSFGIDATQDGDTCYIWVTDGSFQNLHRWNW